MVMEIAVSAT
jgi:hypothetical protein